MARNRRDTLHGAVTVVSAGLLINCAILTATPSSGASRPAAAPGFASEVRSVIAAREYEASWTDEGLQAPNRAHGLRTYFDGTGARVLERRGDGAELARLRTVSVGRAGDERAVTDGEVVASGARVEVRRAGLVEWYENSERGLEHGWTVERRPDGDGLPGGAPLAVEVATGAEVACVEGDRAVLVAGGRRLTYGGLAAWDARGVPRAARLEAAGGDRLRILVEDAGAEYPVTVDPTLMDARVEANQVDAHLGLSVAGAGDVNGDGYDDVIVGAPDYDPGQTDEGAAFVFHGGLRGIGDGTPTNADAFLDGNLAFVHFGFSVAGAGDVNGDGFDDVIVGAPDYTSGQLFEGAAFVFHGGPTGVGDRTPATADATLQSDQVNAHLGNSVAGAGDVNDDGYDDVVIAATGFDAGQTDEGAVFVFHGGPAGAGNGSPANADSFLESNQPYSYLGNSVAGAGRLNNDDYDDIIVGNEWAGANEGAAFVFQGGPGGIVSGWAAVFADAWLSLNQPGARMGHSVAGAGDINGDGFDDVVVSAIGWDHGQTDEGAAFIYHGASGGVGNHTWYDADGLLEGDLAGAAIGASVAGAGDINGDGFDDVVVGAPVYDAGLGHTGAALVLRGSPAGVNSRGAAFADWIVWSGQAQAMYGASVAGAGDTNGDGFDDIVVGAPEFKGRQTGEGAAFVRVGSRTGA